MNLEITFFSFIDIISFSTALMMGLLFINNKTKNLKANIYLSLFLWSLSIEILGSLASYAIFMPLNFYFNVIVTSAYLCTIPLLFFYVIKTIDKTISRKASVLFLPSIVVLLLSLIPSIWDVVLKSTVFIGYLFNGTILFYTYIRLNKHGVKVKNYYSDIENKTLKWIKSILYIFAIFHILWIIEDIVIIENDSLGIYFSNISCLLTVFMIYWIGYNGFSQASIFNELLFTSEIKEKIDIPFKTQTLKKEIVNNDNEFISDKIDNSKEKERFLFLDKKIEESRMFLNPQLNLRTLSELLDIKEKELSYLINTYAQTNFYHYINNKKVVAFKKLLESSRAEQLSLYGLAQEAGFSSKSTFYAAFKKSEKMTPRAYKIKKQK